MLRLPLQGLVHGGEQGGACPCREVVRGALGGRDDLRFLRESRFDPGLLHQEFFILKLGPQGLKVQ